ncbi:palmitoyltransferase ZDHHC18, putative [Entamoeba invadens IP1]|uniref:Palmitoyltransferase n=1 Tax=Entamoeba invadens IP1 TaxID=370355 RepID=A0A0A1TZF0_ENTIV|nr:palmitoyltransferase ZDHHC18, putative [Entamoeba invadens IP1]ELP86944.1 palmitoyltransferase ZDHHC18, putative [Entamoeba invadens IP1]|eukprot:XP_004253715.1 palmitoyltransferase ZDHHC18, putative [Entamoeba invadens IP1]
MCPTQPIISESTKIDINMLNEFSKEQRLEDKKERFLLTNDGNFPKTVPLCCKGHVVGGGQPFQFFIIIGVFLLLTSLHSAFTLRWLYTAAHPIFIVLSIILFVPTIVSFMDPGIVPRRVFGLGRNSMMLTTDSKMVQFKSADVVLYYCKSCYFDKPPKTIHCRQCNNCVDQFDHHCPFLKNCVGRRNYRVFYTMLIFSLTSLLYVAVTSFLACFLMIERPWSTENAKSAFKQHFYFEPIICALTLPFIVFSGNLLVMHTYQISRRITTNERIKKMPNVYSLGFWGNWKHFLFSPLPPPCVNQKVIRRGIHFYSLQIDLPNFV